MKVLLTGVSCVGKTTIGAFLARRIGCPFFDLDEEIERHFGTSVERLRARFLTGYSYRKECSAVLEAIAWRNPECVIALPPSGLRDAYLRVIRKLPSVTVVIEDEPESILNRITFFDIDSKPIDRRLTAKERNLYRREIQKDIAHLSRSYRRADLHADIKGLDAESSAQLIEGLLKAHRQR